MGRLYWCAIYISIGVIAVVWGYHFYLLINAARQKISQLLDPHDIHFALLPFSEGLWVHLSSLAVLLSAIVCILLEILGISGLRSIIIPVLCISLVHAGLAAAVTF